ncbi:hypothetical protein HID58_090081, partial [Brassica napus]
MLKTISFFNYLTEHNEFLPTVQRIWDTTEPLFPSRAALSRFHRKLKLLKQPLRELNKTHYGDLPARTKNAYHRLTLDPTPGNLARAAEAADRWNALARVEEKFYKQKSCVRWLSVGDQNTKGSTIWFKRGLQRTQSEDLLRLTEKFSLRYLISKKRQSHISNPSYKDRIRIA